MCGKAILNRVSEKAKKAAILGIRAYKKTISPLLKSSCRFVPTCSEYAEEALEKYGIVKGVGLSLWRILRCNPFSRGGYDPVEKEKSEKEEE